MLKPIVPLYCSALSIARSAQAERDNESCFFVHAVGVHRFIRRYHVKKTEQTSKCLSESFPFLSRYRLDSTFYVSTSPSVLIVAGTGAPGGPRLRGVPVDREARGDMRFRQRTSIGVRVRFSADPFTTADRVTGSARSL
ncbi:hypothetical protein EVAR_61589_1 [Eumeta japonica]|uniref:Uncharacterized protein n=1 Tax=Eumeta variegata TaxID=151549 RepID=A0A4C1YK54_EUMVA|nr:hypothetical protein EVAR_61589_1 [Eumeta japonica]